MLVAGNEQFPQGIGDVDGAQLKKVAIVSGAIRML